MQKSSSFLQITYVIFLMLFVTNISAKTNKDEFNPPQNLTFSVSGYNVLLQWEAPESGGSAIFTNYVVEINSTILGYCETLYYLDQNVEPGIYEYCVAALYETGQSEAICVSVTVENNPVFELPFSENFSEEELPMGWQNIDNISSGATWSFDNPNSRTISGANFDYKFAIFDSDYWGGTISGDATLLSPKINCSNAESVVLSFSNQFRKGFGSSGTVELTTDGGNSWDEIAYYETESVGFPNPAITVEYNISELVVGETEVQFRWQYLGSDAYWWAIDNIKIFVPASPWHNPPKQFSAHQNAENVLLNWEPPATGGAWKHYDDGINADGISAGISPFYCAALWPAETLTVFDGLPITDIAFFNYGEDNQAEYTIFIWEDGNVVCNQTVDNITYNNWNEITLNTSITIDSEKSYQIGYLIENYSSGTFPAGLDAEVSYPGLSNLISLDGVLFEDLLENYGYDGDWNLQFFVDNDGKKEIVNNILAGIPTFESQGKVDRIEAEKKSIFISKKKSTLSGYNVFKDDILLANTIQNTDFIDLNAGIGTHNYCVKAVYNDGISSPVCADVNVIDAPPVPSMDISFVCISVSIFWITPSQTPTSYYIYRDEIFLEEVFNSNFEDEEFLEGVHSYCVTANYNGVESSKICEDILSETPFSPENLETTVYGTNAINLVWEAPSGKTNPDAELTGYIILRDGEVISSTDQTTYTDNDVEASILYCYTIIAQYDNGCFSIGSNESCEEIPSNISSVETNSNIEVFPNPAKDYLFIKTENHINKISVFNSFGKLLLEENKTTINIMNFETGLYLLKIEIGDKIVIRRFVVR